MTARRTATQTKEPLWLLNAGAHRGAERNLEALLAWSEESTRYALVPRYVDPVPGRAAALAAAAREQGLPAEAFEAKVEEILSGESASEEPLILNLDRPDAVVAVLRATAGSPRPILGYLLLKLPLGELWGIRFALTPPHDPERAGLGALMERLGALTAPYGSSAIVGEDADPAHLAVEEQYRGWFAEHLRTNLLSLVSGLPGKSYPVEVTDDGVSSMLLIFRVGSAWREPEALAREILERPPRPIVRGESFCVAEITPQGIRFHKARLRLTDGQLAAAEQSTFDVDTLAEALSRREAERRAKEAAQTALIRAERQTVSMTSPAWTTD